ncbi:hypothetical protein J6590_024099 [Homalodisca vitripennis]|nr:hypothetical protein J6590_024099 [Homalodisca vitripennis]
MSSEVSDSEVEGADVDYRLVPVDSRDRCVAEVSEGNVSPLSEVKSKLNVQVSGSQVDQVGARINNHAENITFVLQVQPQEQGRLTSLVLEKLETSEAGERVSAHRNIEIIGAQFINDSPDYNKFIDIINASEEDKYLVDDRERFVSDTVTLSQKVGRHCEYENDDPLTRFTPAQLTEIRKMTISRLICNNLNEVHTIQRHVLDLPDPFM